MTAPAKPVPDHCPPSAVSHGVGLAGLAGLLGWITVARAYGMDGPYSALTAVLSCGLPMILWSLLVDKVHLRPSTGINWNQKQTLKSTLDISLTKLAGLWATWAIIAGIYCIGRWYWRDGYLFSMQIFTAIAPFLFVLSIPYILWIDRFLVNPKDGAWHFGAMIVGQEAWDKTEVQHHLRSWAVKGFFLAFMVSIVPGGFADIVNANIAEIATNPVWVANWLVVAMFVVDVQFATVGYVLTFKPLDAHIRTANPYAAAWMAALMCYPPFLLMGDNGPLNYHINTSEWSVWFAGNEPLLVLWGAMLVVLTAVYAWATMAFGLRFSNLTHRGILTHGPYRWTKHPAYVSKNVYWWLMTLPFLVTSGSWIDALRNTAIIAAVSGVYYWRARTEEKHLMADPVYAEYAAWMERHGPIPRFVNAAFGRVKAHTATTGLSPAE